RRGEARRARRGCGSAPEDAEGRRAGQAQGGRHGEGRVRARRQTQERSEGDLMAALVIAEHDNNHVRGGAANAVTAATKMGGDVHVLVAGQGAAAAAADAAKLAGVAKVLHAEGAQYAGGLPENVAALVVSLAGGYSHIVTSATAFGKNF